MINTIDYLDIAAKQEIAIKERELASEAVNGRYYSHVEHQWQSMGWLEWLFRKIFARYVGSVEFTCLRRSWGAIEKLSNIPIDIKDRIEDLFLDSLYETNPRSANSGAISRIFCRIHQENAKKQGRPLNQMDIQQHLMERSFGIFYNKELRYLVASSAYGQLDFYDPQLQKVLTNDHDSLWNADAKRINAIRLAVDYPRMDSFIELYSANDIPMAKIEINKEKVSLVFRELTTNRLLAVANLSTSKPLINWTITLIDQEALDQKKMTPLLLAWAILKYSQHDHFPNPNQFYGYVTNLPQKQGLQT